MGKFGCSACFARQHCSRGGFGVNRITLAALAPQPAIGPRYLEHLYGVLMEVAGQPGAIGACSFDTDLGEVSLASHPGQHCCVTGW